MDIGEVMFIVKILLIAIFICNTLLTGLWILEYYNLIEGEQPYEIHFPFTSLIIMFALLILIVAL